MASARQQMISTVGIVLAFVCVALSVALYDGPIPWFQWLAVGIMAVLAVVEVVRLRRARLANRR